jgi:hypothetical protein
VAYEGGQAGVELDVGQTGDGDGEHQSVSRVVVQVAQENRAALCGCALDAAGHNPDEGAPVLAGQMAPARKA